MILQQALVIVVLAAIASRGCLSNPLSSQATATQSGCTERPIESSLPLNCSQLQTAVPTAATVEDAVLARVQCDVLALRQKSLNACIEHSDSTTRRECCPLALEDPVLSLSDVVLLFINPTSAVRGVVELARNVCKAEEAKFIRGYPNANDQCKDILRFAEDTYHGMTDTLLSYRCGCPNAIVPDGRECPYKPNDPVEIPEDISLDVRGLAKWASRLAGGVFHDMRSSREVADMVRDGLNDTTCPRESVDYSFC